MQPSYSELKIEISVEKPKGKKARTREALYLAASELFLKQGFESTTVDEIAEKAGVTRRTFFRHFPTKDSIVFPNYPERIALFRGLLIKHGASSPPFKAVGKALVDFSKIYAKSAEELLTQYRIVQASPSLIARELEFDSAFLDALAEALSPIKAATPQLQRQARIFAGAVFGAIRSVLKEWFDSGCTLDLMELGASTLSMLENGINSLSFAEEILDQPGH